MKTYRDLKLTLRYNTQLNSKFWVGESMKPEVREGLLRIAEEWAEFANIPSLAIIDVVLVGGNANYNYTKYSDLDLHLIVSKEDIADCLILLTITLETRNNSGLSPMIFRFMDTMLNSMPKIEEIPPLRVREFSPW